MGGAVPSQAQAGVYSAVMHFLKAVEAAGSDAGGAVMATMKLPVDDVFADNAKLREDGRLMKDLFLVEVKAPAEVTGEWDLLKVIRRVPAAEIVRPLEEGGCPLVEKS